MYVHIWEVQIAAANFFQESSEVNHHTKVTFHLNQQWLANEAILWTTKHDHSIRYRAFSVLLQRNFLKWVQKLVPIGHFDGFSCSCF